MKIQFFSTCEDQRMKKIIKNEMSFEDCIQKCEYLHDNFGWLETCPWGKHGPLSDILFLHS